MMLGRSWTHSKNVLRQLGEPNPHTFGHVRILQTNDRKEYVCKANEWCDATHSGRIHQVANELFCARLAAQTRVPIPPYEILEWEGVHCFGSERQEILRQFLPSLLSQIDNAFDIYRIVAFDAWALNRDRHESNLLIVLSLDRTPRGD